MKLIDYKKQINSIPENLDNLEVECFIIADDYESQENPESLEDLTFHRYKHEKENMIETISLLFYKGYENYGD